MTHRILKTTVAIVAFIATSATFAAGVQLTNSVVRDVDEKGSDGQVVHKRVVVQKHVDEHVTKHVTEHVVGHADGRVVERGVPVGRGRWHSGDHFAGNRVVFRDYDRYHVRRPPAGYEWVEDNGELVLISLDTGLISDIFVIPIP